MNGIGSTSPSGASNSARDMQRIQPANAKADNSTNILPAAALVVGLAAGAAGLGGVNVAWSGKALDALAKVAEAAGVVDAVSATIKTASDGLGQAGDEMSTLAQQGMNGIKTLQSAAASAYQEVEDIAGSVGHMVSSVASGAAGVVSSVAHGIASAGSALAHYAALGLSAGEHLIEEIV